MTLTDCVRQRRRRDLNPRAAINDLHPFQGCPFGQLGYFSTEIHMPESHGGEVCLHLIQLRPNSSALRPSGEDGIRTHAPLRTNGFQDRLVMTTSISLQMMSYQKFILMLGAENSAKKLRRRVQRH